MAKGKYQEWLTDDGLLKIKQWARLGLTEEQIAQNMGITYRTFSNWKNKYIPIFQALKKGREQSVEILENSMFKKANGFYEGKTYYPPDNVSLIFLLKNWDKRQYRDKPMSELEEEKLRQETERLRLDNEIKRRILEGDGELDQLEELIKGINHAALDNAEDLLEE